MRCLHSLRHVKRASIPIVLEKKVNPTSNFPDWPILKKTASYTVGFKAKHQE